MVAGFGQGLKGTSSYFSSCRDFPFWPNFCERLLSAGLLNLLPIFLRSSHVHHAIRLFHISNSGEPVQPRTFHGARADDKRPTYPGDKFSKTADLRVAVQPYFMLDGRTAWAVVSASGAKSKLYRCSGASFDTKVNGDLRNNQGMQAFGHERVESDQSKLRPPKLHLWYE